MAVSWGNCVLYKEKKLIDIKELEVSREKEQQGFFGKVHSAIWRNNRVAIKKFDNVRVLPEHLLSIFDPYCRAQHPNILPFYGLVKNPGKLAMVMEMPQTHLNAFCKKNFYIPNLVKYNIALDILKGLNYIHENLECSHGQLKGSKIFLMISPDGRRIAVKIFGFGLSKIYSDGGQSNMDEGEEATVRWRAPETFTREYSYKNNLEIKQIADMYAWALNVIQMLEHDVPFAKLSEFEVVKLKGSKNPHPDIPIDCPKPLAFLLSQCLAAPKERPMTAQCIHFLEKNRHTIVNISDIALLIILMKNDIDSKNHFSLCGMRDICPIIVSFIDQLSSVQEMQRVLDVVVAKPKRIIEAKENLLYEHKKYFSKKEISIGKQLSGSQHYGQMFEGTWSHSPVAVKQWHLKTLPVHLYNQFDFHCMASHHNVLPVFGVCTDPGKFVTIMELGLGCIKTLYQNLPQGQNLSALLKYRAAWDMAKGIDYIHDSGYGVGNLKSSNIILTISFLGEVIFKITDPALSKIRLEACSNDRVDNKQESGLKWRAPETFGNSQKTEAAKMTPDIYSYGSIIWEMNARTIPFAKNTAHEVITIKMSADPHAVIPAKWPERDKNFINGCWDVAQKRYTIKHIITMLKSDDDRPFRAAEAIRTLVSAKHRSDKNIFSRFGMRDILPQIIHFMAVADAEIKPKK